MNPITEKQHDYRANLLADSANRLGICISGGKILIDPRKLTEHILRLHLPYPQSSVDASAQIDALRGSILGYARSHQDWAAPILADISASIGDGGERLQAIIDNAVTNMDIVTVGNQAIADAVIVAIIQ